MTPKYPHQSVLPKTHFGWVLLILAAICAFEFSTHLHIDGELISFGPYELNWGSAAGVRQILNGQPFHFEGLPNVRNLHFFAGGIDSLDLGYTVPTGRLFAPFIGSLFNFATYDVLTSVYTTNFLFWVLGAIATYGVGFRHFHSHSLGLIAAILVATSQGYISLVFGTKTHVVSYSFFITAIFLILELGFWERSTPRKNIVLAGFVAGLGIFFNGTHLMLVGIFLTLGVFRVHWTNLILFACPMIIYTFAAKGLFIIAGTYGYHVGDIQHVIIGNALTHIKSAFQIISGAEGTEYTISGGSGIVHFNTVFGPYAWILENMPSFFLLGGPIVLGFALFGLISRHFKCTIVSLIIIVVPSGIVAAIMSYWPWNAFFGYFFYYSIFGFYFLGALGIINFALLASAGFQKLFNLSPTFKARFQIAFCVVPLIIVAGVNNLDILFGWKIGHVWFHQFYFIPYPMDWDFDVTDW